MGIYLNYAHGCLISGNNLEGNQHGIYLLNSSNNKIINNIADGNSGSGIRITNWSNNNSIFYNTLTHNNIGVSLYTQSNYNRIYNNNASFNGVGIDDTESNFNSIQCNILNANYYGLKITHSSLNANFNTIVNNTMYGILIKLNPYSVDVNYTNNWWGRAPVIGSGMGTDIFSEGGVFNFNPWFSTDIGFTSANIINASLYVKNYVESNHQLPSSVNISGIQVNIPQFLKLVSQVVVNADSGLDDLIVLGDFGSVSNYLENITNDDVLDSEYVSIAEEIIDYMDLNRVAPSNIYNTSLGDTLSFESLVYMYSKILDFYGSNNQTLPDSISVTPWIAVSNPNNVYNFRTQEVFTSIQTAIDDVDTIANDTIYLWKGNYLENVIINKRVTIGSLDDNVTVSALNSSLPIFTINDLGNGSIIQNIFINGSLSSGVFINNSFNNTIFNNIITSNGNGISIYNSTDNEISSNLISNNTLNGIFVYLGGNNTISGNNLTYNRNGIVLNNTLNNTICINLVSKNLLDGISIVDSSADVSFNVISQNGRYGLYNQGNSTVDAQNNWWGSNNPSVSATGPSDIYNNSGTLNCDKWIIMNVNSTCDRSNRTGDYYNYVITADLTHNNHGNDTSGDGNIPDGIPVNFNTTVGTIVSTRYMRNGKAVSNLNSSASGLANVSVTLDNQTNNISVNVTSINVLGIYNNRTNEGFTTIQNAINDNDTLNGDIITLNDGIYTENVVVNKTVTIMPVNDSLVTITGSDTSLAIFTITNSGSGSIISGLTIIGSEDSCGIFLNKTNNCNITGNDIFYNLYGVYIDNSNSINLIGNGIFYNLYGVYIDNSNSTLINGFNNIIGNGIGIDYINSNNTIIDGSNNVTESSIQDLLQIDTTGIVMADTIYNCGPAVLATVLQKYFNINVTQDQLAILAGTDNSGTSMYGIAFAAQEQGLIAKSIKLSLNQLEPGNIVYLFMNGEGHFSIITNITNTTVYLADSSLGNINMTLANFTAEYSGNALIITNNATNPQLNYNTTLNTTEMQNIKGTRGQWVYCWVWGTFWTWAKWHYGYHWRIYPPHGTSHSSKISAVRIKEWHLVYGWFKVSGYRLKSVYAYTLPWNYYKYFRPLYYMRY